MHYPKYRNYIPRPYNIDEISLKLVPQKCKVLELGCGDGRLTEYLNKKLKCRVTTVELYNYNAQNARGLADKIINGDIETGSTQQKISHLAPFDVIYISAFLGSLKDPLSVLTQTKKWLRKEGFIVITLPNIVHFSVRMGILIGKFEYAEHGLCSWEHLHFFTIKTAEKLINESGYGIIYQDYDYTGFPRLEKALFFLPVSIFRKIYGMFPGLFAYQIVFKLKPL